MPIRSKSNRQALYSKLEAAFIELSKDFAEENTTTIQRKIVWDASFPNATKRKNGEIVPKGKVRNTVDTARLRDSLTVEQISSFHHCFTWDAPYAGLVYTGYKNKQGQLIPARRWVAKTLQRVDFNQRFKIHLTSKL